MRMHNRLPDKDDWKTDFQWLEEERVRNEGVTGEVMWINGYRHDAIYIHIDDTHEGTQEELDAAWAPIRKKRREQRAARAAEEAERREWEQAEAARWTALKAAQKAAEEAEAARRAEADRLMEEAWALPAVPCENPSGIVVFDVETTGLHAGEDEILQISAIDGDGRILINSYVRPYLQESWPDAMMVNGITPDMVQDAPRAHELVPTVRGIFESAELLVAYNGNFDMGFLEAWGLNLREKPHYDVMLEFAPIYGEWDDYHQDYRWKSLTTCAQYYGYEFKAHDALEDVRATLHCYRAITSTTAEN